MRSLRRPPQPVRPRPEAALRDAVLLVAPSPLDDAAPPLRGRPTAATDADSDGFGRRMDVVATDAGLVIGSVGEPGREMPSLVLWAMVECSVDAEPALLPDGSYGTA